MILYLGYLYLLIGTVFLLLPLIYLEVGKPKDLVKATLNLMIGITLIIKNKVFDNLLIVIFILITFLMAFYLFEIFSSRWNQLTDKEKNKLTTLAELKNNLTKILEAIKFGANNIKISFNFLKFDGKNKDKKKSG